MSEVKDMNMKELKDMREQLKLLRYQNDLLQADECGKEESEALKAKLNAKEPLPEGVRVNESGTFYRLKESGLSPEETMEYIMLRQLKVMKHIRGCLIFFVVLAAIGLLLLLGNL